MTKQNLITAKLPDAVVDVQITDTHKGEAHDIEHCLTYTRDKVEKDSENCAENDEGECEDSYEMLVLRVNNYLCLFSYMQP